MVQMKPQPNLNPNKPLVPTTGGLQPTPITTQPIQYEAMGMNPNKQAFPTSSLTPAPKTTQPAPVSIASAPQTYSANSHPQGWGIGYGNDNVSGGFNQFSNVDALRNEINRMNTVMSNRSQQGMGNDAQTNYMNMLNQYYQPYQQQQSNVYQAQNNYNNSQARSDANKWNNATIQDIAAKYGFDYSRDYAKQQAEAEAQALRNANLDAQRRNVSNRDVGKQNIDNNLMNQAEAMDRNYFQQMMAQQQNQVGTGMNAGIASDQDLRLQMARQAEMGSSYRDANLGKMQIDENFNLNDLRLAEAMGLIDQQSLAREDSLYNDRLMQGYGQLMDERGIANALDQQMWGRSQAEIDRALNQQNVLRNAGQWQTQFDYGKERDQVGDRQWQQSFDWGKMMDEAGLTGNYNGNRTMQGQQFDWGQLMDRAGLTGSFEGGRTMQGQQFDWGKLMDEHQMSMDKQRFALQQQQAAASRSAGSKSASSSSGASSNAVASTPSSKLAQQFLSEIQNVPQNLADKQYLSGAPIIKNPYMDLLDQNMFRLGRFGG